MKNNTSYVLKRSYHIRKLDNSSVTYNNAIINKMNNGLKIVRYPSENFGERPQGPDGIIDCVVLHYTATDTIDVALKILTDPKTQVSSHYVIDEDGTIYQLVDDDKRAWHAGKSFLEGREDVNDFSIGIELQNKGYYNKIWTPFDKRQINALIKLLEILVKKYNIPLDRIVGHEDVAIPHGRKIDPGKAFPWDEICKFFSYTCKDRA